MLLGASAVVAWLIVRSPPRVGIASGHVFVSGRYAEPPYAIDIVDGPIRLNGQTVRDAPRSRARATTGGLVSRDTARPLALVCSPRTPFGNGARMEDAFWSWLPEHYPELAMLPTIAVPAMVHRAIRPLEVASRSGKIALVVVDGLSLAVWRSIVPIIRGNHWQVVEAATFAWLPTVTAVSRQTIFSGKAPMFFASSIDTTAKEPALWRELWSEVAKQPEHNVGYARFG